MKTTTAATYPIAFNGCSFPSFRSHCVLPTIQDKGLNKRAITMPSANNGNQTKTASAGHTQPRKRYDSDANGISEERRTISAKDTELTHSTP